MKRLLKQSICLLAILCLFAGIVPVQAQAYEKKGIYKIHSMREDKWITSPKDDSDDYYHVYKFKIYSDGYIKVKVNIDKVTGRHVNRSCARLFTTYKIGEDNAPDYYIASFYEGENYIAIKKGTYYFYPNAALLKFKYEHHSVSHGHNYCMEKAQKLTSGKNRREVFAYGYEFAKWYKITLSKPQKIEAYAERMESTSRYGRIYGPDISLMIVNKNGVPVKTTNLDYYTQITGILPKGTYYICVQRDRPAEKEEYYGSRLISLTVKRK